MTLHMYVLISAVVFCLTVHCTDVLWFTGFKNGDVNGVKETVLDRVKRQMVTQSSHTAEDDEDVLMREFPHIVSVEYETGQIGCLGVLISECFVVSSAHCLRYNVASIIVHGERTNISKKIIHPMYSVRKKIYDIGLLQLDTVVNIQNNVVPACLWLQDDLHFKKIKMVGINEFYDTRSLMQTTRIKVKDAEYCQLYLNYLSITTGLSLMEHQMCVFYELEEHWRWRGGSVYVDLIYDDHIVPFVIGMASFAPTGGLHRLHGFVQMSKFGNWITETIREEGKDVSLEPLMCAKRHLEHRRQINSTEFFETNNPVEFMVSIYDSTNPVQTRKCVGALIRKDVVVTLAQCASNIMSYSSRVVFADRSSVPIRDIIIHPDYTDDSLYNNIAVLKLVSETSITPVQIAPFYSKNDKITLYASDTIVNSGSKDYKFFSVNGLAVLFSYECNPSEQQRSRLSKGFHPEHMCLQNELSLVPGSCEAHPGSPVYWVRDATTYLLGLYMLGENCGFGEQAIGLYLYAYDTWIHSVIDSPSGKSNEYVFPFLFLSKTSDECSYPNGAIGTCINHRSCPNIPTRMKKKLPIFYCNSRSVVCCPRDPEAEEEAEDQEIAYAFYRD